METDLNKIMANIYGESYAVTNFKQSFSFNGGMNPFPNIKPNIKYVDADVHVDDESAIRAQNMYTAMKSSKLFSGGAKKAEVEVEVATGVEYIPSEDLKEFIHEFLLHGLINTIRYGSIIVVPSRKTLDKMIDELHDKLKAENIKPYTPEASKFLILSSMSYKRYLMDQAARPNSNDGFEFYMPKQYPTATSSAIIMRTTRAGCQYFFDVSSKDEIKCGVSNDMSGAVSLKYLGRTDKECYVFQGDLPEPVGKETSFTASFSGGALNKSRVLRSHFMRLVNKYNDVEFAANEFLASLKCKPSALASRYSGNYVHAAFDALFACEKGECECDGVERQLSAKKIGARHNAILKAYTPRVSVVDVQKAKVGFDKLMKFAKQSSNVNAAYINNLSKYYQKINAPRSQMLADICTALCSMKNSVGGVRYAFEIADEVEDVLDGKQNNSFYARSFSGGSALIDAVHGAVSRSPFIGNKAREFAPMPLQMFEDVAEAPVPIPEGEVIVDGPVKTEEVEEDVEKKKEEEGEAFDDEITDIRAFY